MAEPLTIKEVCLYCHNLDLAEQFYGEILGFTLYGKVQGRHVFFNAGKMMLLIFNPCSTALDKKLPPHYANGRQHIAFEAGATAYEYWKNRLASHGISILDEQLWGTGKKSFYFQDPHGHLIEITEPGIWELTEET